jgi:putative nucleotidyltransferase with HDIG domain
MLDNLFPELAPTHHVPPNRYHHLGLFDHTLELLYQAEKHLPDFPPAIQAHFQKPINPFANHMALVRLACLFHDIGKPATMVYDSDMDLYRFHGHEEVSAVLTDEISRRLMWGKTLTQAVNHLVRWHLYPGQMLDCSISAKAKRRFFRRMSPWVAELLLLAMADRFSAQGPAITPDDLQRAQAGLLRLWAEYDQFRQAETSIPDRILSGSQVMATMGMEPGPQVGILQRAVQEAFLNGEIQHETDALNWLKVHGPSLRKS